MVRYEDIPRVLVNAVVSAEDKRFFQHSGFDPVRVIKSAYVDVKKGQNAQGASTLSMQLAGMWMLNRSDRSWKRKIPEVLITMHLEQKLTKKQIFEDYANQVPLGQRGSFRHSWVRRSVAGVLRQRHFTAHSAGGSDAGGRHPASQLYQSVPLAGSGQNAPQLGVEIDAREQLHQRRGVSRGNCVADRAGEARHGFGRGALLSSIW